jgi:hypothetical protein
VVSSGGVRARRAGQLECSTTSPAADPAVPSTEEAAMANSSSDREPSRVLAASQSIVRAEKRRWTRISRVLIAVEGLFCLVLGAVGVVVAAQATSETVTVSGFKAGLPQFTILAVTGVVLLVALLLPRALRRVVLVKAIVFAALFVAGAVLYPKGSWDLNMAGALLAAAISLLGLAEFVLLGSERFVSTPSAPA